MFRWRHHNVGCPYQHPHLCTREYRQQPNILPYSQRRNPTLSNGVPLHTHSPKHNVVTSLGCKRNKTEEGVVADVGSKPTWITDQRHVVGNIEASSHCRVCLPGPEYIHLNTTAPRENY